MRIIKKTKEFIVLQSNSGACLKVPLDEVEELMIKLDHVDYMKNGVVDSRKGECLYDN